MCVAIEVYEKMIRTEENLADLMETIRLHDPSTFQAVRTFTRRWSDMVDSYQMKNRKRLEDVCESN